MCCSFRIILLIPLSVATFFACGEESSQPSKTPQLGGEGQINCETMNTAGTEVVECTQMSAVSSNAADFKTWCEEKKANEIRRFTESGCTSSNVIGICESDNLLMAVYNYADLSGDPLSKYKRDGKSKCQEFKPSVWYDL